MTTDSQRPIKPGELMTMIGGAAIGGNQATSARGLSVFAIEEATAKQKNVYDVLRNAFCRCLEHVRPGVRLDTIDRTARDVITKDGYGDFGYWNHDEPLVWFLAERWKRVNSAAFPNITLSESHVLTIEPGVKIPNLNAFTLTLSGDDCWVDEDLVKVGAMIAVTWNGYKVLTGDPPKELPIVNLKR